MYPWDVLEIDAADDRKTIKKAYAKLIRQYRPDEEPEKFQKINQAYQYALQLIKSQQIADITSPRVSSEYPSSAESVSNDAVEQVYDNQIKTIAYSEDANSAESDQVDTKTHELPEEIKQDDAEIVLGNEILAQFHQMAFAEYRIKKQAENWVFLEQYHEIQDLQLRDSLSKELFKRVVEYNSFQLKENRTLLLNQAMVKDIAKILGWEVDWKEFSQEFPESYIEHVFRLLEPQTQMSSVAFLALRAATICFEFLIVFGITKLIFMMRSWTDSSEPFEIFVVLFFIVSNAFSMCSEISLSVVQYAIGFRLYDKYLNLTDSSSEVKRAFVFHVSAIPFYLVFYDISKYLFIMVPVIGVLAIINLIIWIKNKQLLHDWMSDTILMK